MDVYRGDDRSYGAVKDGFEARAPMTADQARAWLQSELASLKNPRSVGFSLRVQSNSRVIATAVSEDDALDGKNFFYRVTLPESEFSARVVTNSGDLGRVMPLADAARTERFFVIFNKPSYAHAEIIAFLHTQGGNQEVDFLSGIPREYLSGMRSKSAGGKTPPFAKLPKPTGRPTR